jgi:heme-degrading monooxygenase HmoA
MTVTSVHVLRYDAGRDGAALNSSRPGGARYWHPGVYTTQDGSGIPIPDEREWTVLATWEDAAAWRCALHGDGPWDGARESWSCLLSAGQTRYNPAAPAWADGSDVPPFGAVSVDEPTGPVAVVTTVAHCGDHLERVLQFARDVESIVDTLPETPGFLGHRLGGSQDFPQSVDSFTFSLWASWSDARKWAYRTGVHSRAMKDHMGGQHVVRGSFTTFGVLEARGSSEVIDGAALDRLLAQPTDRRLRLTQVLSS